MFNKSKKPNKDINYALKISKIIQKHKIFKIIFCQKDLTIKFVI